MTTTAKILLIVYLIIVAAFLALLEHWDRQAKKKMSKFGKASADAVQNEVYYEEQEGNEEQPMRPEVLAAVRAAEESMRLNLQMLEAFYGMEKAAKEYTE